MTGEDKADAIQGETHMDGTLNDAQCGRLLQIAGRCWMHRTLSTGVKIHLSHGRSERCK